jgi:hypothetical protein
LLLCLYASLLSFPKREVGPIRAPITSVHPATSVKVSQSRQYIPPRQ